MRRKFTGAKQITEDTNAIFLRKNRVVGEHLYRTEVPDASRDGAVRRENVGMSNHKSREKRDPRKSKVSSAMEINGGLGGPKAMAKAAADGQLVNIPARPMESMEGRRK